MRNVLSMQLIDYSLELLLDLDGTYIEVGLGFWVKIEARIIEENTINKPFGIKYSLTLHAANGERVLGYDNAHGLFNKKPFAPDDHIHKQNKIFRYEFISAEDLLKDFWNDVNLILKRSVH
jgi:hypothetical protein